jgi:WD40 repeat protein
MALANQGTQLLVAQNFEGIHLLDLATKQQLATKALGNVAIFDLLIAENQILVALANGQVIKLAYPQLEIIHQARHTEQSARRFAQHPSLPGLGAVAYSDGVIRLLETNTLKIVEELQGHTNSVFAVQFSADGKYLLSAGRDAKLKVWDTHDNFRLVQDIPAHLFAINDIYFHPFKPLFATCSMDKSVKVWSAETFKLLKVIDKSRHAGHGNSVNRLLWTTTDELLISTGDDRNIHLWKLSL